MQMSSPRFTRLARLCATFAMASLVFVLLGLAGCGTGSSTTRQPCQITSLAATSPIVPNPQWQYRLGFWEQGIIAVAVVADESTDLPDANAIATAVSPAVNSALYSDQALARQFTPVVPFGELMHVPGGTAETAFLQLQYRGASDLDDGDLKTAINAINQEVQSTDITKSCAAIVGASPDWMMGGGSGGDFIGGSPDGPPTPLGSASANSAQTGGSTDVYVLDTADPLVKMGSTTPTPCNSTGHTCNSGPVASTLCPPTSASSACSFVNTLGTSVDEVDAKVDDETAYLKSYDTIAKSMGLTDASFREHGLFVSAIIHHVAPGAKIHLRRVLNDQGVGTTYGLLFNLIQVANLTQGQNAIVNLSLAVELPPSCLRAIWTSSDKFARGNTMSLPDYPMFEKIDDGIINCSNSTVLNFTGDNIPDPNNRLFAPLGIIVADMAKRVTIVAAAGNDATSGPDMPADFCGVTPVAALDAKGNPAPFSNTLQGKCLNFPTSLGPLGNRPVLWNAVTYGGAVSGETAPGVGICSLYAASASGPGAATWNGTSFATAFVSGRKAGGSNQGQPCVTASATHTCSSSTSSTTSCTVTLTNDAQASSDFNWTASSDRAGATFAPASGTVARGTSADVIVNIPNSLCPVKISFTDTSSQSMLSFTLDSSCR